MHEQSLSTAPTVHDFPFPRDPAVELSAHMGLLRDQEPVARIRLPSGEQVWLVTRYDDVRFVLSDSRFSMGAATAPDSPELSPMVKMYPGLFSLDPPLHTQVRRLFTHALHQQASALHDIVTEVVGELVEALERRGRLAADLIGDFCEPLVTQVAAGLLGVSQDEVVDFRTHFAAMIALTGVSPEQAVREAEALSTIVTGIVERKRAHPADDVFTRILEGFDADGTLPDRNLTGLGISVMSSTANSPVTQISYAVVTLLRHRAQWERLVQDPGLLDSALDECFRYSAPLEVEHLRVTTEDVEVGGVLLPAGSAVLTSVAAANRDPDRFPAAEAFDIARTDNRHLGFGFGPHTCAGARVGTEILRVTLATLVARLPGLRLAVSDQELFLKDRYSHALSIGTVPIVW